MNGSPGHGHNHARPRRSRSTVSLGCQVRVGSAGGRRQQAVEGGRGEAGKRFRRARGGRRRAPSRGGFQMNGRMNDRSPPARPPARGTRATAGGRLRTHQPQLQGCPMQPPPPGRCYDRSGGVPSPPAGDPRPHTTVHNQPSLHPRHSHQLTASRRRCDAVAHPNSGERNSSDCPHSPATPPPTSPRSCGQEAGPRKAVNHGGGGRGEVGGAKGRTERSNGRGEGKAVRESGIYRGAGGAGGKGAGGWDTTPSGMVAFPLF